MYSVQENRNITAFATYGQLASWPKIDHSIDSHFVCESQKLCILGCIPLLHTYLYLCARQWKKVRVAQIIDCRTHKTHDRKATGLLPGCSGNRNLSSRVNFPFWLIFNVCSTPCVTTVAHKRPQWFCKKSRWQSTPKQPYTFNPMKSEWADYAVQA